MSSFSKKQDHITDEMNSNQSMVMEEIKLKNWKQILLRENQAQIQTTPVLSNPIKKKLKKFDNILPCKFTELYLQLFLLFYQLLLSHCKFYPKLSAEEITPSLKVIHMNLKDLCHR